MAAPGKASVSRVPDRPQEADVDWISTTTRSFTITTDRKEGDPGYYVRKFAIDDSVNGNKWAVTADSIKRYMGTFVGCPVVMIPGELNHPVPEVQDAFKVGEIVATRVLDNGRRAEDTIRLDESAASLVYSGSIRYTSVQISFYYDDTETVNEGTPFEYLRIHKWIGRHDAMVADPAYGKDKAVMRHICQGTESECKRRLPAVKSAAESAGTAVGRLAASLGRPPTQQSHALTPFVADLIGGLYKPCTMARLVSNASADEPIGIIRDAHPDMTEEQVLAMAIAPGLVNKVASASLGDVSEAMRALDRTDRSKTAPPTP